MNNNFLNSRLLSQINIDIIINYMYLYYDLTVDKYILFIKLCSPSPSH